MSAERSVNGRPIWWAIRNDPEVPAKAHPVPKPVVGRIVEPACGEPFYASAMFDKEPIGRPICRECSRKYLEEEDG